MALADSIKVLKDGYMMDTRPDNGRLIAQKLIHQGDAVGDVYQDGEDDSSEQGEEDDVISHSANGFAPATKQDPSDTDSHDDSRRRGDKEVYKYYFTRSGYTAVSMFVLFMVLWTFCTEFSGKPRPLSWCPLLLTASSDMDQVVVCCQRRAAKSECRHVPGRLCDSRNCGKHECMWYCMVGCNHTFFTLIERLNLRRLPCRFAFINIISNSAMKLHADILQTTLR